MGGPLLDMFVLLTPQLRHRGKQTEADVNRGKQRETEDNREEIEEVAPGRGRMVAVDWQEEVLKGQFSARKRALAPV